MLERVRRFLSSPRRRRRLGWSSAILIAVGCGVAVGVLWPNTGNKTPSTFEAGKPQVVHQEPPATPLTKNDLVASERIVDEFVRTAVLRRHLEVSYAIVTDQLRGGMAKSEWMKADIPVVPFPAKDYAFAKSKLRYSSPGFARYDVAIFAKPKATTNSMIFSMELKATGQGKSRHWLVDYWEPLGGGISQPAVPRANPLSVRDAARVSASNAPLATAWVLVPLGVFGLIVLIPVVLFIRGWHRNRQAQREYGSKTLPPLKKPS
jgi:hypothetical protein